MYWIDNPVSYRIDNPKIKPLLINRAYQLLVRRGIEVIRILNKKKVKNYLYYDPNLKSIKCSNSLKASKYEYFPIREIIYIGLTDSSTLYILLKNQCLIFRVDTSTSANILKAFLEYLR